MIDSQAVKNTCNASIASKGFVTTKQRMGSKGIWLSTFFTHCTKANVTDDQGLIEILAQYQLFQSQTREYSKITILVDHGYHPWNNQPSTARNLSPDPDQNSVWALPKTFKAEKLAQGKSGFVAGNPMGGWTLECLMERCKCLVKTLSGL